MSYVGAGPARLTKMPFISINPKNKLNNEYPSSIIRVFTSAIFCVQSISSMREKNGLPQPSGVRLGNKSGVT